MPLDTCSFRNQAIGRWSIARFQAETGCIGGLTLHWDGSICRFFPVEKLQEQTSSYADYTWIKSHRLLDKTKDRIPSCWVLPSENPNLFARMSTKRVKTFILPGAKINEDHEWQLSKMIMTCPWGLSTSWLWLSTGWTWKHSRPHSSQHCFQLRQADLGASTNPTRCFNGGNPNLSDVTVFCMWQFQYQKIVESLAGDWDVVEAIFGHHFEMMPWTQVANQGN